MESKGGTRRRLQAFFTFSDSGDEMDEKDPGYVYKTTNGRELPVFLQEEQGNSLRDAVCANIINMKVQRDQVVEFEDTACLNILETIDKEVEASEGVRVGVATRGCKGDIFQADGTKILSLVALERKERREHVRGGFCPNKRTHECTLAEMDSRGEGVVRDVLEL